MTQADTGPNRDFEISIQNPEILDRIASPDAAERFAKFITGAMETESLRLATRVTANSLSGQILKRRTGSLARSVAGRVVVIDGVPAIRVGIFRGPAAAYAGILERGGVIKPKNAKALAIPVNRALTPAGVARYVSPRDYPGRLVFRRFGFGSKAVGGLYDAEEVESGRFGDDGISHDGLRSIKPLWLLVRSVRMPAFQWLSKPVIAELPVLATRISEKVKGYFDGDPVPG